MRLSSAIGVAIISAANGPVMAKELPVDEARAARLYDSGVIHQELISKKIAHWEAEMEAGLMASDQFPRLNATKCVNGIAEAISGDPLHTFKYGPIGLYQPRGPWLHWLLPEYQVWKLYLGLDRS
ncbi:hypothetical protein V2G26_018658 [Clonostachys chloroleuca]